MEYSAFEKFRNAFLLRINPPPGSPAPYYTTGSIVLAALVRVSLIGLGLMTWYGVREETPNYWVAVTLIWFVGAWPAYLQYQKFNDYVDKLQATTLCGACRHFSRTNQLCTVLDEHVTDSHVPCEGELWEPV